MVTNHDTADRTRSTVPKPEASPRVIDTDVPLLSHDHTRPRLRDVAGPHGLAVVCVGKTGERGFQMLYLFAGVCARLEECGVNVVFVYQKASARRVQDATSVLAARFKSQPSLLLDDGGRFFAKPPGPRSLRMFHFDGQMQPLDSADIALDSPAWEAALRARLEDIAERSMH